MFSQSCTLLQSKNQSPLPRPLGHNLSLLASRSYSSSTKTFMDIKPVQDPKSRSPKCNQRKSNMNLLGFVCGLNNSTQNSPVPNLHNRDIESLNLKNMKLKNHCKELLEPTVPGTPSYLVGGFVGSKSQLGCRSNQSFDLNVWDLIGNLRLADLIKSNPCVNNQNSVEKQSHSEKSVPTSDLDMKSTTSSCKTDLCRPFKCHYDEKERFVSKKQSYADVAKANLDLPMVSCYESPSSVTGTSIKHDDKIKTKTLPYMFSNEDLALSPMLPVVTLPPSDQNNEQVEVRDNELDLLNGDIKETNITSSLAACEESQTSLSANANGQIRNSDVTCCQTLSKPRISSVIEVNKDESRVPTLDYQILSSTSLNNNMDTKGLNCDNSKSYNSTIKGILKKTQRYAGQFNGIDQLALMSHVPETTLPQNRNRIISQCSDDSEDSFVVFEQSEDDTSDYSDDDDDSAEETDDSSCCESDEDSLLATKDSWDCETRQTNSPSTEQPPPETKHSHPKQVRFAEGSDLVQVLEVERLESEGRAEWEMHALDCWRFKQRIQRVEPCLQLVLEPAHRHRIYQQRFLPQD